MIIIEGMDNSGKTTLGKALSEYFAYPLIHSPGFCPRMLDWTESSLLSRSPRIYDRYPCISERVYGPTLRNNNAFDSVRGRRILKIFYDRRPLVIYCKPPDSIIIKNMGKQMGGIKEKSLELIDTYSRLMAYFKISGWLVIKYDFTDHSKVDYENLISVIVYKEGEGRTRGW